MFLLLSQYPVWTPSTITADTNSGRFGTPTDAVEKNFRECLTAGQTASIQSEHTHQHDEGRMIQLKQSNPAETKVKLNLEQKSRVDCEV